MFDYARKMQLAVSDTGRRVGLKAAAGALGAVAAGFLVAALWTLFARNFGWGPLWASVAVAALFLVIAGILWAMGSRVAHPVPTTDELKREVEARVSLATEIAMDRAKTKAREVVDMAENKVHSLIDTASYKAASMVDGVEGKVQRFARDTVADARDSIGLGAGGMLDEARHLVNEVRSSRAGPAIGVLGAFAVGVAIASRLKAERAGDDWHDDPEYYG